MDSSQRNIFSIIILGIIFSLFLFLITGQIFQKAYHINLGSKQYSLASLITEKARYSTGPVKVLGIGKVIPQPTNVNWRKLYPFERIEKNSKRKKETQFFERYKSALNIALKVGDTTKTSMPEYHDLGVLSAVLRSIVTNPREINRIRVDNGYWIRRENKSSQVLVNNSIKSTILLKKYLDNNNIPFFYIQPAKKNCQFDKNLPFGINDYTNENIENLLSALQRNKVNVLDLRSSLHNEHLDHYSMFYKTDHHWANEAWLWAARKICYVLKNKYGYSVDQNKYERKKYNEKTYTRTMFGSFGHDVTRFYADPEDFSILSPKFETDFTLTIPDKRINTKGAFEEIFYDYSHLHEVNNEGGGYAYEAVLYGNRPLVQIKNNQKPDGPRILMIRDSFASGVAPFLALNCSELDLLDVRPGNGNFNGSVRTYIERMKPDIVLMLASTPLGNDLKL